VNLSAAMAPTFVESVQAMVDTVRALGPSPLKTETGSNDSPRLESEG
jgi:coenzyme F420-reducing hydrogenase delta subunit